MDTKSIDNSLSTLSLDRYFWIDNNNDDPYNYLVVENYLIKWDNNNFIIELTKIRFFHFDVRPYVYNALVSIKSFLLLSEILLSDYQNSKCKVVTSISLTINVFLIISRFWFHQKMTQAPVEKSKCVFCNIANRVENTEILYEDEDVCVFRDIKPASDYHILTIPKRHIEDAKSLTPSDKALGEFYSVICIENALVFSKLLKFKCSFANVGSKFCAHLRNLRLVPPIISPYTWVTESYSNKYFAY